MREKRCEIVAVAADAAGRFLAATVHLQRFGIVVVAVGVVGSISIIIRQQ